MLLHFSTDFVKFLVAGIFRSCSCRCGATFVVSSSLIAGLRGQNLALSKIGQTQLQRTKVPYTVDIEYVNCVLRHGHGGLSTRVLGESMAIGHGYTVLG